MFALHQHIYHMGRLIVSSTSPYSASYADHCTADPISGEPTCTNGHHDFRIVGLFCEDANQGYLDYILYISDNGTGYYMLLSELEK